MAALTALGMVPYAEGGPTAYEQNEVRAIFLDGKLGMIQACWCGRSPRRYQSVNWGVTNLRARSGRQRSRHLLITRQPQLFSGTGVEDKAIDFAKFLTAAKPQFEYEPSRASNLACVPKAWRPRQAAAKG